MFGFDSSHYRTIHLQRTEIGVETKPHQVTILMIILSRTLGVVSVLPRRSLRVIFCFYFCFDNRLSGVEPGQSRLAASQSLEKKSFIKSCHPDPLYVILIPIYRKKDLTNNSLPRALPSRHVLRMDHGR